MGGSALGWCRDRQPAGVCGAWASGPAPVVVQFCRCSHTAALPANAALPPTNSIACRTAGANATDCPAADTRAVVQELIPTLRLPLATNLTCT